MEPGENLKKLMRYKITEYKITEDSLSFIINEEIHNWKFYAITRQILGLLELKEQEKLREAGKHNLTILARAYKKLKPQNTNDG